MATNTSTWIPALALWIVATLPFPARAAAPEPTDSVILSRSVVSAGDIGGLQRVMARARRGDPVTVAVIGGSITQGAKASSSEHRYGEKVAQWWREKFPAARIKFVNAGIGATGSDYGAMRFARDVLGSHPDFMVIEYAVNDSNSQDSAETLEGIVRQLLKQPNHPAASLLFMMNHRGGNAQEWLSKVGAHYRLPMVSYRDALWPEIEAGRLTWTDISPDEVHPNDRGMAEAARFVTARLDAALASLPASSEATRTGASPLPAPIFTDTFERTLLLEGDAMKPTANTGWAYDSGRKVWRSDQPGSVIEFELEGTTLFTMHQVIKQAMGRARVTVDSGAPRTLDGWFDQTWGGYRQSNRVARNLGAGKHRIRFELLQEKSEGSAGRLFEIMGLGAAGLVR